MTFLSMLTLIFITLKLTNVIAWSWWLILLPFYGSILLGLLLFVVAAVLAALK